MEIEQVTAESLINEAYLGYRIGDCLFQPKWCNWHTQRQHDLGYIYTYTARKYPHSLVGELFEVFAESFYEITIDERISRLAELVYKRPSEANQHDLVIHLRLGDVNNDYDYLGQIEKMIQHGWTGSNVVLVAGFHYKFAPALIEKSIKRIQSLARKLQERGYSVRVRSTTPDSDLVYMSQSNWLITGYRGYAQLAYEMCRGNKIYCDEDKTRFADQITNIVCGFGMSQNALISAETGRAREKLEIEAVKHGGVSRAVKIFGSDILALDIYHLNKVAIQSGSGALKPLCILQALKETQNGDVVFFHDIDPQINRINGRWITRSLEPIRDFCLRNNGFVPGVALPQYGPNQIWTKRDCFVLMDCDAEQYWQHPQISSRFSMWQATDETIKFVEEWLQYCLDPRISCAQENVMGKDNLPGFKQHRYEQSILTNLVVKHNIQTYTPEHGPADTRGKIIDVNFLAKQIEFDKLFRIRQSTLSSIGIKHSVNKVASKYIRTYEYWLEEIRNKAGCVLEKGLGNGQALKMWREYFPKSEINGVDQFLNCPGDVESFMGAEEYCKKNTIIPGRIVLHKVQHENREQMERLCKILINRGKSFNIVIDSGISTSRDQQLFMGIFFKMVAPGGLYAIENLQSPENTLEQGTKPGLTTLDFIRDLARHKIADSPYLTAEENIQFRQQVRNASITWFHNRHKCIAIIEKEFD